MSGQGPDLVDAAGTRHAPARGATRIVSLVPSVTELVCELGLADRLVGRTGFCVHPRDAVKRISKVGGTKDVDLDKVRSLEPTHVILNVDENRREDADALAKFVPHLIVTHPLAPSDNLALYRLIGGVFAREREAERLCREFEEEHAKLLAAAGSFRPQRVVYLIWKKPWMTVSRDTYVSRMLELVKWNTVPERGADRYPRIDLEGPVLDDAELVLLSSEPYMFREKHVAELRDTAAVQGKKLALIDGEMTSWYGSRAIRGLDYLRRFREKLDRVSG